MELLVGVVFSLATEVYKKLSARWGEEITKELIYLLLFVGAVAWVILVRHNIITQQAIEYVVTVMAASIATYELVIKHLSRWFENWQKNRKLK